MTKVDHSIFHCNDIIQYIIFRWLAGTTNHPFDFLFCPLNLRQGKEEAKRSTNAEYSDFQGHYKFETMFQRQTFLLFNINVLLFLTTQLFYFFFFTPGYKKLNTYKKKKKLLFFLLKKNLFKNLLKNQGLYEHRQTSVCKLSLTKNNISSISIRKLYRRKFCQILLNVL